MQLTWFIIVVFIIALCQGFSTQQNLSFERLSPPFSKEVFDFYRSNYKRGVRPSLPSSQEKKNGQDFLYILRQSNDTIVAALRWTQQHQQQPDYAFVRALCVSRDSRRHGLALHLLQKSSSETQNTYCFADPALCSLYEQAGFSDRSNNDSKLPAWLLHSYSSMTRRVSRKHGSLNLFVKSSKPRIILLQHCLEAGKPTATGWLLEDRLYRQSIGNNATTTIPLHVDLQVWTWNGRNDTASINEKLQNLNDRTTGVLWTGGSESNEKKESSTAPTTTTYIILDGTWQQAKTMFRKISGLWNLRRISLETSEPSIYELRKGVSGWREKFSSSDSGQELLCTAEVAAALLQRRGDASGAKHLLDRLDTFQSLYPKVTAPHIIEHE